MSGLTSTNDDEVESWVYKAPIQCLLVDSERCINAGALFRRKYVVLRKIFFFLISLKNANNSAFASFRI